jgi:hypothetical protein
MVGHLITDLDITLNFVTAWSSLKIQRYIECGEKWRFVAYENFPEFDIL